MITYLKVDYPELAAWLEKKGMPPAELDLAICSALYDFDHTGAYEFKGETLRPDTVGYTPVDPTLMDKLREKQIIGDVLDIYKGVKALEESEF